MRIRESSGRWTLVALLLACCLVPGRLAAQDPFAGKKAGDERDFFCWCPPGKFTMGSPKNERPPNEDPVEVTLTRGFWLGKYEVTQAQYQFVMGKNPSRYKGVFMPVESVSWDEANEFCEKLTTMEIKAGRLPKGWEYRLPTEAQWEYACRAGTTTVYSFGNDAKQLGDYAWYARNSDDRTHPVGQKKPNTWGLCNMHGNVSEWCRDAYQQMLPGGIDPEVTSPASRRVIRGGGWLATAFGCRSAMRFEAEPEREGSDLGFRVALVPSNQQAKNQ